MSDKQCGCSKPVAPCCVGQHRSYIITAADIGQPKSILQHNCKCGTCCRRLALFADRPNGIIPASDWVVKAIARVTFGCAAWCYGGFVEVDWKRGVILDLLGDFVNVELEVIEVLGNVPAGTVFSYGAVSACCGAGGARGCATRTTELITVPDGVEDSVVVPIPPFAYAVSFAPQIASQVAFFSASMVVAQSGSGAVPPGNMSNQTGDNLSDPWMLIGGAESIILTNLTGNNVGVEVVFHIGV